MSYYDKFDRIKAVMEKKVPDRIPWAIWGHFPALKWINGYSWEKSTRNGEELAKAHLAFLRKIDYPMDLLKVTPFYRFMSIKWGTKYEFKNNEEDAQMKNVIVKDTKDWEKLWVLDPDKELREYVRAYEILSDNLKNTPIICTIVSPIIQAMSGISTPEQVVTDLKENPEVLKKGLEIISETVVNFARSCQDVGVSGIYYGIGSGGTIWSMLNREELESYALYFDNKILSSIKTPIKLLHICSTPSSNPRKLMEDGWFNKYPVTAINWWSQSWTPLNLGKKIYGEKFCIWGGLDQEHTLRYGTPDQVDSEVKKAIIDGSENGGFMLGPGCSIYQDTPIENINAIGRAIDRYGTQKK